MPEHIKIPQVPPRVQYVADGVQTVFPFPFPLRAASHLKVLVNGAPQTAGFTISGTGQTGGGTITFATAPASGARITLFRRVPVERITDFLESGPLSAESLNDELDSLTTITQQIAEDQSRMLRYPEADPPALGVLPDRDQRAGKVLAFDESGNPTAFAAAAGGGSDTYLPPGTGAVERTLRDKVVETVSAKDFGAKGDGLNDDTLALQKALAAAKAVFLPAGTYRVTSTLVVGYGQSLYGAGQSTILKAGPAVDPVIELPDSYATVRDLSIEGGTVGLKLHGRIGPCVQNAVTDITIWDAQYGLVLDGRNSPDRPCYWNNFSRVLVARPQVHGVWLRRTGAGDTPNANRFHMLRVYSLGAATSGVGIYVEHGRFNNSFSDCEVNLSTAAQACVRVGANADKNLFLNLYTETLAVIPNVVLDAGSVETAIINLLSASAGPAIEDHSGGQYTTLNAGYPTKNRLQSTRITELTVEALRYDTEFHEPPTGGLLTLDTSSSVRLISAFGGAVEARLPPARQANGQTVTIKKTDGSRNIISITEDGGPGPDGRTVRLGNQNDFVTVVSNGAKWWTVTGNNLAGNCRFTEGFSLLTPDLTQNLYTVSAFTGAVEVRLPAPGTAHAIGRTVSIKKTDTSTNAVTVTKEGGGGPDGEVISLTQKGHALTAMSDGAAWHILSRNP